MPRSSDHRGGEPFALDRLAAGLSVEIAPEPGDVLLQLADHQVTAVSTEIELVGRILGAG